MFDHYRRLFLETKDWLYYIHSQGYVEKFPKERMGYKGISNTYLIRIETEYKSIPPSRLKELYVTVENKDYLIRDLVASHFYRGWHPDLKVNHKNKDRSNCNYENLIIKEEQI